MWKSIKEWLKKNKKVFAYWGIILFLAILVSTGYSNYKNEQITEVSYNEFLSMVKEGKVDTIYYNSSDEYMRFTLYNDKTKNMTNEELKDYKYDISDYRRTLYPAYEEFRKDMLTADVKLEVSKDTTVGDIIASVISLGFPILWIILIFKAFWGMGKGVDKSTLLQTSDVKFSDVIGQDEILDDIKFVTKMIKDPTAGEELGAKTPKGILLSGEPGTGKTLIAKAIAGEAGVPFLYMNASSFIEMYVGVGAKRVRELFKIARENKPCIIFIDEIDAVGAKRDSQGSNSESDQTINALLQEMDGFNDREGIFVIAATNRPDKLDKALIRAGRFDRQIAVNPPKDWKVRKELFDHYLKEFKLSEDVDTETLSKQVVGFTGADIAMVCNESSIIAVMQNKSFIDNACIEEAIDKKIFKGNRSKKKSYEKDKKIVAYHEAGHAVVTYLCGLPIARASIQSTTSGVGGVVFQAEGDSMFTTDEEFRQQVMIAYGGRASEQIKFDNVTTGASNDITQATKLISNYIERYGFDKDFGLLDMGVLKETSVIDNSVIVERISKMSRKLYNNTVELLSKNYVLVEALATKLLEEETLSGNSIKELLDTQTK